MRSVELFRHREDRRRLAGTGRTVQQKVRQPVLTGEPADGVDDVLVRGDVGELTGPILLHPHLVLLGVVRIHGARLLPLRRVAAVDVHGCLSHISTLLSQQPRSLSSPFFLGCPGDPCVAGSVGFGYRRGVMRSVRLSRVPTRNPGDDTRGSSRVVCVRSSEPGVSKGVYFKSLSAASAADGKGGRYQPPRTNRPSLSHSSPHELVRAHDKRRAHERDERVVPRVRRDRLGERHQRG